MIILITYQMEKCFTIKIHIFSHSEQINQYGFIENQSTITNLLEYASFVLNSIEDGNQVNSIYTDFSKAFDRVRHQLLLNEMSVGIEPARCMCLGSYLSRRIQKIRIGDAISMDIKVTSGVPQGSHLGTLCTEDRRFSITYVYSSTPMTCSFFLSVDSRTV
jgi:hypothetical protein